MIKKQNYIILLILFLIELFTHFSLPLPYSLMCKPFFLFYLAYIYYDITNMSRKKDILFLVSIVFSMVGEFLFDYRQFQIVQVFLLIAYLVEHQLYISIFRLENTKLTSFLSSKNYKITIPILLFFFLFYGFLMMPSVPESLFILTIFYCVQLAILGAISTLREVAKESYKWVIVGISLLVISDALTSLDLFVPSVSSQYVLIRVLFLSSKVFLAMGLIYTLNPQDKEHT